MAEIGDTVKYNSRISAIVIDKADNHILIRCPNGVKLCTKDTLTVIKKIDPQTKLF